MATEAVVDEVSGPKKRTPREWHKYWQREKTAADERLKDYIRYGNEIVQRYLDEHSRVNDMGKVDSRLNLFHKTVKTTLDMLYGRKPKVEITREHKDPDDDPARVAAVILKRIIDSDDNCPALLRSVLQDRLLPGMGVARVRYKIEEATVTGMDGNPTTVVANEEALTEYVHWQDFRWGWGRTWEELPWIGFRSWMPKERVRSRFGDKVAENLEYKAKIPGGDQKYVENSDPDKNSHTQEAEIWEFWHRAERKVYWWSPGADILLDEKDDPLGLEKFWPVPRPLAANLTTSLYMPTADFMLAQDLYNEIDTLQTRISVITEAVKVVGVYDQSAGGSVGRMLTEGNENELVPVDNWAMFAEKGGLQGSVQWFPVQDIVNVLQVLDQVQKSKIAQLYELTGMSTLLRGGDTDQYVSDGTNKLSAKFGSVAIQALQDEFARFASDLQALKAEIIAKHYAPTSVFKQSNAQFLPRADQMHVQPALQLLKSPDIQWRIEISPESVAMVDYAQLQSERVEYLNALSTFLQSSQAVLKQVPDAMPILLEFMKFGLAGFKGSDYLEGMLDQAIEAALQSPPQQQDGQAQADMAKIEAEKIKQQTEQMKIQGDLQKIQAKAQADMSNVRAKVQGELAKIQTDAQRDVALEDRQSQYALLEIAKELEANLAEIDANLASTLTIEAAQARHDMRVNEQEHAHRLSEISRQGPSDA